MSCEIIWVALSGNGEVGSTSKWNNVMCARPRQQGSVGLLIYPDLRGFLAVTIQQPSLKYTCCSGFDPNTLRCCLHLSPSWMAECWLCAHVNLCVANWNLPQPFIYITFHLVNFKFVCMCLSLWCFFVHILLCVCKYFQLLHEHTCVFCKALNTSTSSGTFPTLFSLRTC